MCEKVAGLNSLIEDQFALVTSENIAIKKLYYYLTPPLFSN
jgi:hypothetical protein